MKKTFITISLLLSSFYIVQAQNWPFAPASPTQVVNQQFGSSKIIISYSRPSVKKRTIFGNVVPYDKVWRTGANSATTISFGDEVTLPNGNKIASGKYGLLTIPGKTEWTIILSKDTTVTGPANYKQENDIARFSVKPKTLKDTVQTFTIDISNIKTNESEIVLRWEKTEVGFKIKIDTDTKILKFIDEQMSGDDKNKPYYNAAVYYYENNKDLNKALEWVNKAVAEKPDAFWMLHQKAKIQNKLGDKQGAITSAEESTAKAKAANNEDYVKLNEKLIKEIKGTK